MSQTIRSFIALSLSDEIRAGLDSTLAKLKPRLIQTDIRWVQVGNIHLTLKFLGEVEQGKLDAVTAALYDLAARHKPFGVSVSGLGVFPNMRRPRVIWVGVQAPPTLASLQHDIDVEMSRLGFTIEDRDFSPHLTLGRIGRNFTPDAQHRLTAVLSDFQTGSFGDVIVNHVNLYRSDLRPSGPLYTVLINAPLSER